jgi:hypothetical protein
MSVRKRTWTTRAGEQREAWLVDYTDQAGRRHVATFHKKKDADRYHDSVRVDVRAGVHVAPSASVTIKEADESWIRACEARGLERATIAAYRQHLSTLFR